MPGQATEQRKKTGRKQPPQPSIAENRLKITLAAAMFAGLALSPKLWLSARVYPLTPVWRHMGAIPVPLDYILYAALLALLVVIAVISRPAKFIAAFAVLAIVVALFDQSRWQPWFYQYLAMLIAVGLYDHRREALNTGRLIVVCTYLWSGLQKTNADFVRHVFPFMIEPLTRLPPASIGTAMNSMGILAPLIECAIGIGLLTRRFRTAAVFAGLAMHAFILLAIGPLGQNSNSVVWPWNVAMMCLLVVLFWKRPELSAREIVWPVDMYQKIVFALFAIAPVLSFFNLWDGYLSSALYSGTRNSANIYVSDALRDRLPPEIREHIYPSNKPGTDILIPREWSMSVLNAGINAEPRIYKSLGRYICRYAKNPDDVKLWIKQTNVLFSADKQVAYEIGRAHV